MSLFSSLNLARLSLAAHQSAIQTVGQNIANATTEGYARQRVEMRPTPADDLVFARLGTGVSVDRIERVIDRHLEETLREARSGLGDYGERERIWELAGAIFNDLDGGGISVALGRFFDALEDLAGTPEDATVRHLLVEEATTLANSFHYLDGKVRELRRALDEDATGVVEEVNRIIGEVASLNREVVLAERGGLEPDTANDLRTRRDALLGRLSELLSIRVIENSRGAVQVLSGSEVLVYDDRARTLDLVPKSDGDIAYREFRFADDGQLLRPAGGRLAALLDGRDEIAVGLRDELNTLARELLVEFDRIHAGGEGLDRLRSVRATHAAGDRTAPLGAAGFPFPIENGHFELQVVAEADGSRKTYRVPIDLDGSGSDTTLESLVADLNALVGADYPDIGASITGDGYLEIRSASEGLTFTFRNDETGFLTAAGLGTFFTGSNARDIGVRGDVLANPGLIATGRNGLAGDNSVAREMLALRDRGYLGESSLTLEQYYNALIGSIGVAGAEARDSVVNQEAIATSLTNQRDALSGVSVDEEAIELIRYQRAYQGSARFLTVVDRLLDTLLNV